MEERECSIGVSPLFAILPCNRVLMIIFRCKTDERTGWWRKLHAEKHYNLYSSPNTIAMMKSIGREWVGHLARLEENMVGCTPACVKTCNSQDTMSAT
jgi:acyl-coenzyme A synthetase/AMP-(fatty) acid ligase